MSKLELISILTCPFVQRSVIVLNEKGIAFKRTNIDLANKPDWFQALSPMGKVPILCIEPENEGESVQRQVLFESTVICEYIDEITPPSLHPLDPFRRALNRAFTEFASELLILTYRMLLASEQQVVTDNLAVLQQRLAYLEANLGEGPFFNGADFAIVDAAYAPLMLRFEWIMEPVLGESLLANYPKIRGWKEQLIVRDAVQRSVPPGYLEESLATFRKAGSVLLQGAVF